LNKKISWDFSYPSQRMPVLAHNLVATSQPLASQAGLEMMLKGGNAVDAALATAITLTVVEPTMNGIGSDAFAILWDGKRIIGLNASGRSPSGWTPEYFSKYDTIPVLGWDSVTVPGAVSAWVELSERYGQLPFSELFKPAIKYAKNGFIVSPITAQLWKILSPMYKKRFPEFVKAYLPNGKAPKPGELFNFPDQAHTLELIAKTEGEAFYSGDLAKKIVSHAHKEGSLLTLGDLEEHKPTWENTLTINFNDVKLHELPPNSQGLAALIMLGIFNTFDLNNYSLDSPELLHLQIESMKLAFFDAHRYISDSSSLEFDPNHLLKLDYLTQRANLINPEFAKIYDYGIPNHGDTVYLTSADADGMMISYIQSNFWGFGSGIVIPDTGISMQNRGCAFSLEEGHPNQVGPNKRPFHTIIPAFVTNKEGPIMSFGVMGGPMQPQGAAQLMIRIFEYNQNPQAAIDAPRWQVQPGLKVSFESGFSDQLLSILKGYGHNVVKGHFFDFGGAQLIYRLESGYLGASDWRKDGQAVGF